MAKLDHQRLRIASDILKEHGFMDEAGFLDIEADRIDAADKLAKYFDELMSNWAEYRRSILTESEKANYLKMRTLGLVTPEGVPIPVRASED